VDAPPRHIVVVGQMGAGKTTLGRALAARLDLPLSDSDDALLASEGATARELQERIGQSALHALEAAHLLRALDEPTPHVICAAASTVEDDGCAAALSSSDIAVFWLWAAPASLAARQGDGHHRPPPVPAAVRQRREARLASLHAFMLDTEGMSPADLLDAALRFLA
jgi:shikimate kinase